MSTLSWVAPEAIATALTTELNSLANGGLCTASSAIDNETDLYEYVEVELALASLNPTGSPYLLLYLVKSVDGTNYEDSNTTMSHQVVATLPVATGSATKRVCVGNILIPPCKFKLAVQNQTNVTLAAASNTVKYRRYNEQVA